MIYKDFQDLKLSALGMGCMRLPTLEPGGTAIDYARAGALVDEAVRGGRAPCACRPSAGRTE